MSDRLCQRRASRALAALSLSLLFLGGLEFALEAFDFTYTPKRKILWKPIISGFVGTLAYEIPTEFSPPGYLWVAAPNTFLTDSHGFRRPEIPFEKRAGTTRIAFLGGSTTQGGLRPYPERTIRLLNEAAGTNRFEALNVACSSYSTHQSLRALSRWVLPRAPDVLVIYHGWNDIDVAGDGYPDHQKDLAATLATSKAWARSADWLLRLRLTQALAWLWDRKKTPSPSLRVPFERFERNLEQMLRLASKRGVRCILFTRPATDRRPLPGYTPVAMQAYRSLGLPANPEQCYLALHQRVNESIRAVAARNPGTQIFDANTIVANLQARHRAGELGEEIHIFMRDGVHLYEFAEEFLAIELASVLVPELENRIRDLVQTPSYHFARARDFLEDEQAFEAEWHAREAIRTSGARFPEAEKVLRQARANFEFARLFRAGRWGGEGDAFDEKLRKLERCLEIRPSDFGVCLQIYRIGVYYQRPHEALRAINAFRPANEQARREFERLASDLRSRALQP